MIVNCIQKGGSFLIYRTTGAARLQNGYVVSFNGECVSYITSKGSKTIIVIDEKGHRIKSFCSPHAITQGPGWVK